MPVTIHGKQYVTVAERIKMLHDSRDGNAPATCKFDISTVIISDNDDAVTVRATVDCAAGRFTGHATSQKKASGIEGGSPLEVAETSAVGRALGFAGFGSAEGIASAEEVQQAQPRQPRRTPAQLKKEAGEIAKQKPWGCSKCKYGTYDWQKETGGKPIPGTEKNCPECGHLRGAKGQLEPDASLVDAKAGLPPDAD